MNEIAKWTKPYYGIQHLGKFSSKTFCILLKWFLGCEFSPIEEKYDTLNDAKQAGEKYLIERNINIYE